ncbi:MAG: hypothetical protein LBI38_04430 [Oscillospiraceae bacterium]|jgi:hypothetical protein|nr:hypothetical protein [Oscillospiraceae bacterium]
MIKKRVKILISAFTAAVIAAGTVAALVSADEPYVAYDYDWWAETYPVQNGYIVDRVVTGADLKIADGLKNPSDLFVYDKTGEIYIADTGNSRLVICDSDFQNVREMKTFRYGEDFRLDEQKIGNYTSLNKPQGVFVTEDRNGETLIYIADHDNERVLACYADGDVWMEYTRPASNLYDQNVTFNPKKVIVDNAGNVYICIKSITRGAVVFSENGSFNGYYGANRVEKTFNTMLNYFLKFILTREQMEQRTRPVPVEFSNFAIDDDNFIYTVTEAKSADLDVLKKLDPAGRNVFAKQGYDDMIWGDFNSPYVHGKSYKSSIVGVAVDKKGDIFLLDATSGKIFQYSYEGELMFIFGGIGEQKGLFKTPNAIETYNDKVYILDGVKNSITVYKLTEFGMLVNEAMGLFNRGLYAESREPWEEILRRDANYYMAYIGMGNALLSLGEFKESLDYFHMHSRGGYNRAFKDFRIDFIRKNFNNFLAAILIVVVVLTVLSKFLKRRKRKKAKLAAAR